MEQPTKNQNLGLNPYHLNQSSSAKEFSNNETADSPNSVLDTLSKFVLIQNEYQIESGIISQDYIITDIDSLIKS